MNLEKRTVRNKVWWIAGAILLPLILFLALGAQDQVVSYSVFKVRLYLPIILSIMQKNGSVYFICS